MKLILIAIFAPFAIANAFILWVLCAAGKDTDSKKEGGANESSQSD